MMGDTFPVKGKTLKGAILGPSGLVPGHASGAAQRFRENTSLSTVRSEDEGSVVPCLTTLSTDRLAFGSFSCALATGRHSEGRG